MDEAGAARRACSSWEEKHRVAPLTNVAKQRQLGRRAPCGPNRLHVAKQRQPRQLGRQVPCSTIYPKVSRWLVEEDGGVSHIWGLRVVGGRHQQDTASLSSKDSFAGQGHGILHTVASRLRNQPTAMCQSCMHCQHCERKGGFFFCLLFFFSPLLPSMIIYKIQTSSQIVPSS